MNVFDFIAILLVISAAFSYFNYRVLRLPTTIGLMVLTMAVSLAAVAVATIYPDVGHFAARFVHEINFTQAFLHGMLGFLLFAGRCKLTSAT